MQQQRPSKLPLVVGGVLILATIARHRRRARLAAWSARAGGAEPRSRGHHGHGYHDDLGNAGRHAGHRRHGNLAARLADCAERMAAERGVEYV